jgi:hypothetical protein
MANIAISTSAPSARRAGSKHRLVPRRLFVSIVMHGVRHCIIVFPSFNHCSSITQSLFSMFLPSLNHYSSIIVFPSLNHCSSINVLPSLGHWVIAREKRSLLSASCLLASAFASALAAAAASLAVALQVEIESKC